MAVVSLVSAPARVGRVLLHARRAGGAAEWWDAADGTIFCSSVGATALRRRRSVDATAVLALDEERYLSPDTGALQFESESTTAAANQAFLRASLYLAPSRSVGRDVPSLRSVLDEGERFVEAADRQHHSAPAYVPIVVGPSWRRARLDDMCAELSRREIPVALMFAAPYDPLSTPDDIQAALQLLSASPNSVVLRCDLSVIGLVACGAAFGSIGATPDMRHVFLPMKRAGTRSVDHSAHVFVPALRAWVRGSVLTHVEEHGALFRCDCRLCDGRSVLRFSESGSRDDLIRDEAEAHAALAWREIVTRVLEDDVNDRKAAWLEECAAGREGFRELRDGGIELSQPGYLSAWAAIS